MLEVTDPQGTVYNLLNAPANFIPPTLFTLFVNATPIPLGDYVFHVRTTSGAEFLATKKLSKVAPLAMPPGLAPANNAVVTTLPTFQWGTVPGGVAYRVRIRSSRQNAFFTPTPPPMAPNLLIDLPILFTSPYLPGTSFTLPPGVLSPGRAYYWYVEVIDAASLQAADNRTRNDGRDALSAFFVLGPYAEIHLNQSTLTIGDVLRASLRVVNTATTPTRVGLKIWVGLPTGTVIPVATVPDATLPPSRTVVVPFLNVPFLATFPRGTYSIGVQLYDPDTGHRIGADFPTVNQFTFTSP